MHFVNILSSRTPVELNGNLFLVGLLLYVFKIYYYIHSKFFVYHSL
jgi:hypothetical protein